ncbi:hypothetical protein PybrP1_000688 [[Pythium] brassicae (nom. inval.)]|nr:hypothetical protein PybrP1_000688 [[Pythium] brassicae (nom. inval.)]
MEPPPPPPASASPAPSAAAPRADVIGPDEILSLPPPPSHPDMDDDSPLHRPSASSTPAAPSSATAKASAAALSLAAAAKSRLSQGGRMMLAPLGPPGSHTAEKLGQGLAALPGAAASSLNSLLFAATPPASAISASDPATAAAVSPRADSAADAALRLVSAQQRTQLLEDLVQCRRADWSYLKAMHSGTNYWLNIALLREQQVLAHVGERPAARRGVQFFYLGLGLGRLLGELRHPRLLALDGCQLLEELEFYFASAAVQGMKLMVATSSTLHEPVDAAGDDADADDARYSLHEPFRPTIYKWNQRPVYRRLTTPPIPFALDYREVMLSLCDLLAIVYSKLVEDNSSSENVNLFQAILRFDERIKKLVIDPVKKEFSAVALSVLADEMASVRRAYASGSADVVSPASSTHSPVATGAAAIDADMTGESVAIGRLWCVAARYVRWMDFYALRRHASFVASVFICVAVIKFLIPSSNSYIARSRITCTSSADTCPIYSSGTVSSSHSRSIE